MTTVNSMQHQHTIPWFFRKLHALIRIIDELGFTQGFVFLVRRLKTPSGSTYSIKPRHANHQLLLRAGTSDPSVFRQIFFEREYEPLMGLNDVKLIVDCGANVGYSSAFLLTQFPSSHVIAVEPDPDNFNILSKNLEPYNNRAVAVRAGVWSNSHPLKVVRSAYRDGREWSVQVRPTKAGEEPDLVAVSVPSLLESSGFDRISLLKVDIEGAEVVVFGSDVEWLDLVDAIAIELHDDSHFGNGSNAFLSAIRGRGFNTTVSGELTICRRSS
jgi:FkbM family methyltransferase